MWWEEGILLMTLDVSGLHNVKQFGERERSLLGS